jgi:hypothetical protein
LKTWSGGKFEDSILAFTSIESNELRRDSIHIMEHFGQECAIIKYKDDNSPKKIFRDGQERSMDVILYNTDSNNRLITRDSFFTIILRHNVGVCTSFISARIRMILLYLDLAASS